MEELRAGEPLAIGGITIIPIEQACIVSNAGETGCWLAGFKRPFAVIVCDGARVRAYDIDATEVAVDALIQKVPNLGGILEGSGGSGG